MKRRSVVASFTAAILALGVITPAALATQSGSEPIEDPQSSSSLEGQPSQEDPDSIGDDSQTGAGEGSQSETGTEGDSDPEEVAPPSTDTDESDLAPADDADIEESDTPSSAPMMITPMGIGTFPPLGEILDPSNVWPLPTGIATAEPDPVFKRGSSGYHDPFVVAGGFVVPNLDLLAEPLRSLLKSELCTNPLVTTGVDTAVFAATAIKILPTILTKIESKSPDAVGLCSAYVDELTPSEILSIVPLDVRVTMTNQDDPSDVRVTTVPFETGSFILGSGYVFAAKSTDFPGGYFNAGTYDIQAELLADATVGLPQTTMTTTVDWSGRNLLNQPRTGTTNVNVTFPPISLNYTFDNEPVARLINTPTMTVIEAPDVDANWDYSVGLRVNGDGYDGIVNGTVDYTGTLTEYNDHFRTDLLLFKVGRLLPVERVSVTLDENFEFSQEFSGLGEGRYFAIPVISSTRFLPVPVTGDATYLQVLNIRADFQAPELDCQEETGLYQLEGSVHNNTLPPVFVTVELDGPKGSVGSQTVLPTRTHFDISAQVGAGDYTATFSAPGARSVTVDGPSVLEGTCPSVVALTWSNTSNVCPATQAFPTVSGTVDNPREGVTANVTVYKRGLDGAPDEFVDYDPAVPVDPETGEFSFNLTVGLGAGTYYASAALYLDGAQITDASTPVDTTVTISECASLGEVAWDPAVATNTCPADTATSTLSGEVVDYREGIEASYELYVATGNEDDPWALVEGYGGAIEVSDDGAFSLEAAGLAAGEYAAFVALVNDDQLIETVEVPLTVDIADCPTPKPTPGKPGGLAKTGAFVLPILLLGGGAIGGGYALRRRGTKS